MAKKSTIKMENLSSAFLAKMKRGESKYIELPNLRAAHNARSTCSYFNSCYLNKAAAVSISLISSEPVVMRVSL